MIVEMECYDEAIQIENAKIKFPIFKMKIYIY
jgi:hypothetical protein